MTHKGTVTLETERLILRAYKPEDAEDIQAYGGVAENVKYMMFGPNSIEDTRDYVNFAINANNTPDNGKFEYVAVLKESGRVIGQGGIACYNDFEGELGWIFHRDYWRQGYGTEFARALLKFGFEEIKLGRIVAHCDAENVGSYHLMEKIGMTREGLFRHSRRSNKVLGSVLRDELSYAILAEDYFAATPKETETASLSAVKIIPYEEKYRDDMIFCFLSAKDALSKLPNGRPLTFKTELLDIRGVYLSRGDVFYLAIDEDDRVVGMIGTETVSPTELWLKRLFIKPEVKGKGIGSKLLATVEKYAAGKSITVIHTRFADWYTEAAHFYPAKGFTNAESNGYLRHMIKHLS